MRSTVHLLLSRIGQQRRPFSPVALHSASYVRFYTSHNPSEEGRGVWNVLKNCSSWIKIKQDVRVIVPEAEAYVIERYGGYVKTLTSGIHSLVSRHDKVAHVYSLKEETITIPHWPTMTTDHVGISIDGSLCVKIVDPKLASYAINEPMHHVIKLAQSSMELVIKGMTLDETFEKRDTLNERILMRIREFAKNWGFECLRYEIRDLSFLGGWKETKEKLAIIAYETKAKILVSKAKVQAMKNIVDALRTSRILATEATIQTMKNIVDARKTSRIHAAEACSATRSTQTWRTCHSRKIHAIPKCIRTDAGVQTGGSEFDERGGFEAKSSPKYLLPPFQNNN